MVLNDGRQAQPLNRASTRARSNWAQDARGTETTELMPLCIGVMLEKVN